ncbi:MAG: hypothetical protein C0412_12305, partial [Flavobacterium sp.]|nr:hypothetical protein [Flavobacterium sp.]
MKKIFLIAVVLMSSLSIFAQNKEHMVFQAEIANRFGDVVSFFNAKNKLIKTIQVNKNGVFKDTMNVPTGRYAFSDGNEFTIVYLKNGFDLKMKMDAKMFDESIVYTGKGANENNFLAQNSLFEEKTDIGSLLASDEKVFFEGLD